MFDIDYSDKTTATAETLPAAIMAAEAYIAEHPTHQATFPGMTHQVRTTARIFDSHGKQVATVTLSGVQTLSTDPGF